MIEIIIISINPCFFFFVSCFLRRKREREKEGDKKERNTRREILFRVFVSLTSLRHPKGHLPPPFTPFPSPSLPLPPPTSTPIFRPTHPPGNPFSTTWACREPRSDAVIECGCGRSRAGGRVRCRHRCRPRPSTRAAAEHVMGRWRRRGRVGCRAKGRGGGGTGGEGGTRTQDTCELADE